MSRNKSIWEIWGEITCGWEYCHSDDGEWFESACGSEIIIEMNSTVRFCPCCGKPIDCLEFGGTTKAAQTLQLTEGE